MDISNERIVIATHYLVYGAAQALREYLINNKVRKLLYIAHPLTNDEFYSCFELIDKGRVTHNYKSKLRSKISVLNYCFDIFKTLKWVLKDKNRFNLFVGVDSLNAMCGIVLKKLGRVKKVVFYTIDYVPNRFNNFLLNKIYHWMDKYCVKNADETWNVSPRMSEGREKKRGLKQHIYNKQRVVPIGIWFDKIKRLPFEQIKKKQLLFVGHLLEKQGVQLVLEVIPDIVKTIPAFHFLIIGGGEYENTLKEKARQLNIEYYITFAGWIKDREELSKRILDSAVAIAMYNSEVDTFTYYADPTKLKDYLSVGLPIILTSVPHNATEIEMNKCGKIVNYKNEELKQAIIELMKDENMLREYRNNAVNYIKQFDWNIIFLNALSKIL